MRRLAYCLAVIWLLATAAHADRYTWVLEVLEPHPGTTGAFTPGINEAGTVAGDSEKGSTRVPTVWGLDGVPIKIFDDPRRAFVRRINTAGDVGGFFFGPRTPFRTKGGVLETLGGLSGFEAIGTDLNDAGVLVGNSFPARGEVLGTWWGASGTPMPIGTFGGATSNAQAINNAGFITGFAEHTDGRLEAYLWNPHTLTKKGLGILPLPGYNVSWGTGVNKHLAVVGYANDDADRFGFNPANTQAWIWTPKRGLKQLVVPGDPAFVSAGDINDHGYIVGSYHPTHAFDGRNPVVWQPDGTCVELMPLFPAGTTHAFTTNITNSGYIVGGFTDPVTNRTQGVRLRPVVMPVEQQLDDLIDSVDALGIPAAKERVLLGLLDAAKVCHAKGRTRLAIVKMRVFSILVGAWRVPDAGGLHWSAHCAIKALRR